MSLIKSPNIIKLNNNKRILEIDIDKYSYNKIEQIILYRNIILINNLIKENLNAK